MMSANSRVAARQAPHAARPPNNALVRASDDVHDVGHGIGGANAPLAVCSDGPRRVCVVDDVFELRANARADGRADLAAALVAQGPDNNRRMVAVAQDHGLRVGEQLRVSDGVEGRVRAHALLCGHGDRLHALVAERGEDGRQVCELRGMPATSIARVAHRKYAHEPILDPEKHALPVGKVEQLGIRRVVRLEMRGLGENTMMEEMAWWHNVMHVAMDENAQCARSFHQARGCPGCGTR